MISSNASASLEWLFEKSLRDNVVHDPADSCVVTFFSGVAPQDAKKQRRLVALNISSYLFRIVTLFGFDADAATAAQFARIMRRSDELLEGQALLDAFEEFANMVCGEVNRGLAATFRHVGMSTPFVLENSCLNYLTILQPSQVQTLRVAINDAVNLDVVVCICLDSETDLDFRIDRSEQVEASSGELEMF